MQIHTALGGERLSDIAKKYGVSEESIRRSNGLENGECLEGEELLILVPTRTYTARRGDSVDRISHRFGVRQSDIMAMNPLLRGGEVRCGQEITLRSSERPFGMSVANGYFYNGCPTSRLRMMLPYLTYVTVAEYAADESGIRRIFDGGCAAEIARKNGKIPLVRVYDCYAERYRSKEKREQFGNELIERAYEGGYKGVVINAAERGGCEGEFSEFIVEMRRKMIGLDLILITEINGDSPTSFSEFADGSVISYQRLAHGGDTSFKEGESKTLADLACRSESAKVFVDLPSLARCGDDFCSIDDAMRLARNFGAVIKKDDSTLVSSFDCGGGRCCRFCSPSSVLEILKLVSEYDYMGIALDVMRTPMSHVMMYNAMFKTAYYTSVRTREGCSREV